MNKVIYTTGKLNISQSLQGAEGVSEVVEGYANENLRQIFNQLELVGASIYDKQQAKVWKDSAEGAFDSFDIFSDRSFFENMPYSSMSYGARVKLLEATKTSWLKKLKMASMQNCQKFLSAYDPYMTSDAKSEVVQLIEQKRSHLHQSQEKTIPNPTKSAPKDFKNPF